MKLKIYLKPLNISFNSIALKCEHFSGSLNIFIYLSVKFQLGARQCRFQSQGSLYSSMRCVCKCRYNSSMREVLSPQSKRVHCSNFSLFIFENRPVTCKKPWACCYGFFCFHFRVHPLFSARAQLRWVALKKHFLDSEVTALINCIIILIVIIARGLLCYRLYIWSLV